MDEFEKNNELETEKLPENPEEILSTDAAGEAAEAQEAAEGQEAETAEEAEEAADAETEDVPEEIREALDEAEADLDAEKADLPDESDKVFQGGDLQSCEDITEEPREDAAEEEIPEEELCKRCYTRRRDDSVEGFEYCSVCVEEMAATKVSFGAFFFIFLSALAFIAAAVFAAVNIYIAKPVHDTGSLIKQHRLSQAMEQFNEAEKRASELNAKLPGGKDEIVIFETGTNTIKRYIRLIEKVGGPINAGQVIENAENINVKKLSPDMKAAYDEYLKVKETDSLVYEMFKEYQSSIGEAEPDYKTLLAKLDALSAEHKDLYAPLMGYYRYYSAKVSGQSLEVQLAQLEKLAEDYPEKLWLYVSPTLETCFNAEKYEKAIECCDKVLKTNLNDSSAMIYKARSYYAMGKTDEAEKMVKLLETNGRDEDKIVAFKAEMLRRDGKFDEVIALCDEALEKNSLAGEIYRQKAIALMLKGDMEQAHEVLNKAYGQNDVSVELVELLAISASKKGDTKMLQEMKELLAYNGIEFSEKTQQCIDGKLTIRQIFMEGRGDLE